MGGGRAGGGCSAAGWGEGAALAGVRTGLREGLGLRTEGDRDKVEPQGKGVAESRVGEAGGGPSDSMSEGRRASL